MGPVVGVGVGVGIGVGAGDGVDQEPGVGAGVGVGTAPSRLRSPGDCTGGVGRGVRRHGRSGGEEVERHGQGNLHRVHIGWFFLVYTGKLLL